MSKFRDTGEGEKDFEASSPNGWSGDWVFVCTVFLDQQAVCTGCAVCGGVLAVYHHCYVSVL